MRWPDDDSTVLSCWWIALKFEETAWERPLTEFSFVVHLDVQPARVNAREAHVLRRIDFVVPFRTLVRRIYDAVPAHNAATIAWLYVLLHVQSFATIVLPRWCTVACRSSFHDVRQKLDQWSQE